ncbi:acyl carrier protein [Kitasatospora saccharophila]|uniref:acyl carrier protein n=1 Tax=Kitasatospora saccharophila TaxID=407973 RepID=UPI0031DFDD51
MRLVLREMPKLADAAAVLPADADLWSAGMDSLTSVQVMVRLEDRFDVEFPDATLTRETFSSIAALTKVLSDLLGEHPGTGAS